MTYLILVRHGESRWNLDNKFTGWVDVPLSEKGIKEAIICGKAIKELPLDIAFTSKLARAQETLLLILAYQKRTGIFLHDTGKRKIWSKHSKLDKKEIPIYSSDKINERYYGKLQGLNKNNARKTWGEKKVHLWRRSYDIAPPGGECLKDVYKRTIPYYKKEILLQLKKGKNVLVSAHGNSLRALIKYLEGISDEDIPNLELPTGKPIVYKYSRGKLTRDKRKHSFTRPLHWTNKKTKNQ